MSPDHEPDADDAVRRLLADARHDEPLPADVAARLDGTLADLHEQVRAVGRRDQLAARRRRTRRGAWLVAAAAAVVAGGMGLGRLDLGGASTDDASDSGGTSSGVQGAAPEANQAGPLPVIRPGHVREDVVRRAPAPRGALAADAGALSCVPPGPGQVALRATYRMQLAALVYDPPRGGEQQVSLYRCDGVHDGTLVTRVTIPAG